MKLILTVDTEADNQWKHGRALTLSNIAVLPRFQRLCERYGFRPTYLITHEVATDSASVAMLKAFQDGDQAEIGTHLHPWTSPPLHPVKDVRFHRFPSDLGDDELRAKLVHLTDTIMRNFGRRPTSYRAGRWGFDARQVKILAELGYVADCSVTPKVCWQSTMGDPEKGGGPDFRAAPLQPYFLSDQDVCRSGDSSVLEIPMTVLFTHPLAREDSALAKRFLKLSDGTVKRVLNRTCFGQMWLRLFNTTRPSDFESIFQAALRAGLPHLEFMIHSSELSVGTSPYSKTQESVDHIFAMLEKMLETYRGLGVEAATLTEFAEDFLNVPDVACQGG